MKRFGLILTLALVAAAAVMAQEQQKPDDETPTVGVMLSPAAKMMCDAEGGCVLVTKPGFDRAVQERVNKILNQNKDAICGRPA